MADMSTLQHSAFNYCKESKLTITIYPSFFRVISDVCVVAIERERANSYV